MSEGNGCHYEIENKNIASPQALIMASFHDSQVPTMPHQLQVKLQKFGSPKPNKELKDQKQVLSKGTYTSEIYIFI